MKIVVRKEAIALLFLSVNRSFQARKAKDPNQKAAMELPELRPLAEFFAVLPVVAVALPTALVVEVAAVADGASLAVATGAL